MKTFANTTSIKLSLQQLIAVSRRTILISNRSWQNSPSLVTHTCHHPKPAHSELQMKTLTAAASDEPAFKQWWNRWIRAWQGSMSQWLYLVWEQGEPYTVHLCGKLR